MAVAIRKDLQLTDNQEFTLAQMIAVVLHLLIFAILSFIPQLPVQEVPVRVLSIKLGGEAGGGRGSASEPAVLTAPAYVEGGMVVPPEILDAPLEDTPVEVKDPEVEAMLQEELSKLFSKKNNREAELTAAPKQRPEPPQARPAVDETIWQEQLQETSTAQPLVPPSRAPTQYVREDATGSGSRYGNDPSAEQERIRRYTQQLSLWFHRRIIYPEAARQQGLKARGDVLVTINRRGEIQNITMHKSTGYRLLDDAALETASRANPMPAVPEWYKPGQPSLSFIFPVKFGR